MDVLIIGGFLGSGKTTLLLQLIEYVQKRSSKNVSVAVLENEIGSVGIDDRILEGKGYAVTTMLSGCACCTLAGDLPQAVRDIQADFDPDLLVIETTGLAVPRELKRNLLASLGIAAQICTVADASRWRRMLVPLQTLLRQQIEAADVICINKVDLVDENELRFVERTVRDINGSACCMALSAAGRLSDETLACIGGRGSDGNV